MIQGLKRRVFQILEEPSSAGVGRAVQIFLIVLICMNVAAVILGTVSYLASRWGTWFFVFEVLSVIVFTGEYLLRLWVAPLAPRYQGAVWGRVRYALTPLALVDLWAVLPFYLPMLIPLDLRFIRALRVLRLIRVMKIGRYSESIQTLGAVLREQKEQLLAALLILLVLVVISSSLIYYVERDAQPEAFSSIPAAMWWSVATLTTVGYGDIYPVTPVGKILAGVIAVLGIGLFALPAGILGSGFIEKYREKRQPPTCPHCGKNLGGSPSKAPPPPAEPPSGPA